MLTASEFKTLYALLDTYITSDECMASFEKKGHATIDYTKMIMCVDELVCEGFEYANPYKITDRVNKLNGKNDFNKTLVAFKNERKEIVKAFKYFDLKN